MVILDESVVALNKGLLKRDEIEDLIENRPLGLELVLTGRSAPQDLVSKADVVTEMVAVKHYFQDGVMARTGIEK